MSRISNAANSMAKLDELARQDTWLNRIHPLAKLLVTLLYLVLAVSWKPRQLTGILGMALYPFLLFEIGGLSFKGALYRLRIVLPVVCLVGILNPFFDREPVLTVFGITLTGGAAQLRGLDKLINSITRIAVHVAKDPGDCAVTGTGMCLDRNLADRTGR